MKKILILTVNDYSVKNPDGTLNTGTTLTYLSDKLVSSKQSATPELATEVKKHPLPGLFTVEDFEIGNKKNAQGASLNTFTVTQVKFVKEVKLF